MSEIIIVSDALELRAVEEQHVTPLHQLVLKNKSLAPAVAELAAVCRICGGHPQECAGGNMMLHQRGYAKMFLIFEQGEVAGVISFNQIEPLNKAAYIGYWLDEDHRAKAFCLRRYRH